MWPFTSSPKAPNPEEIHLRAQYEIALKMMVKPTITTINLGITLHRVCREIFQNEKGQKGVILCSSWRGYNVFHQITKKLEFSKSGPKAYKFGIERMNPRTYGIFDFAVADRGTAVCVGNVSAGILGFSVMDMDTEYRPFMEFSDWKHWK